VTKYDDVIDGREEYERGEGEMSSVLRTDQELYVLKLIECGLSNLTALDKNKLVKITLCTDTMLMASPQASKIYISSRTTWKILHKKFRYNSTFIYSTNMVMAWRQRHRA